MFLCVSCTKTVLLKNLSKILSFSKIGVDTVVSQNCPMSDVWVVGDVGKLNVKKILSVLNLDEII